MFNGIIKKITSPENPLVHHLTKLKEKSYRKEAGSALIISEVLIRELCDLVEIRTLLVLEEEKAKLGNFSKLPIYFVTEKILKKITGLPSPPPWCAEVALPKPTSLNRKKRVLALDQIADPGNMGTLVRTAIAFGWEGLFLLPGCTDLFSDKTLRASRGATLLLPFMEGTYDDLFSFCEKNESSLLVADIHGRDLASIKPLEKVILLLGNEAQGVSEEAKRGGILVRIPISPKMESLNVAIAGAIFMHKFGEKYG